MAHSLSPISPTHRAPRMHTQDGDDQDGALKTSTHPTKALERLGPRIALMNSSVGCTTTTKKRFRQPQRQFSEKIFLLDTERECGTGDPTDTSGSNTTPLLPNGPRHGLPHRTVRRATRVRFPRSAFPLPLSPRSLTGIEVVRGPRGT